MNRFVKCQNVLADWQWFDFAVNSLRCQTRRTYGCLTMDTYKYCFNRILKQRNKCFARSISRHMAPCWRPWFGHPWGYSPHNGGKPVRDVAEPSSKISRRSVKPRLRNPLRYIKSEWKKHSKLSTQWQSVSATNT